MFLIVFCVRTYRSNALRSKESEYEILVALPEALSEAEAMRRFSEECLAAFGAAKRGISCVVEFSEAPAAVVAPEPEVRPTGRRRLYQAWALSMSRSGQGVGRGPKSHENEAFGGQNGPLNGHERGFELDSAPVAVERPT